VENLTLPSTKKRDLPSPLQLLLPMQHLRARAVLDEGPTSCVWLATQEGDASLPPVVVKVRRPVSPDAKCRWGYDAVRVGGAFRVGGACR
jgi:hypothetical protein